MFSLSGLFSAYCLLPTLSFSTSQFHRLPVSRPIYPVECVNYSTGTLYALLPTLFVIPFLFPHFALLIANFTLIIDFTFPLLSSLFHRFPVSRPTPYLSRGINYLFHWDALLPTLYALRSSLPPLLLEVDKNTPSLLLHH